MIINKNPIYKIGDLFIEYVDGLNMSSGIITGYWFDKLDDEFVYSILWSDMALETEIFESIVKWRVQNEIFIYYPVIE
jgi:hypothetical protein